MTCIRLKNILERGPVLVDICPVPLRKVPKSCFLPTNPCQNLHDRLVAKQTVSLYCLNIIPFIERDVWRELRVSRRLDYRLGRRPGRWPGPLRRRLGPTRPPTFPYRVYAMCSTLGVLVDISRRSSSATRPLSGLACEASYRLGLGTVTRSQIGISHARGKRGRWMEVEHGTWTYPCVTGGSGDGPTWNGRRSTDGVDVSRLSRSRRQELLWALTTELLELVL